VFTAPQGGPVRHELFYKGISRPAIEGDPDNADPAKRRAALWPEGHRSSIAITFDRYGHLMPGTDGALAVGLDLAFRSDNVVPLRRQVG